MDVRSLSSLSSLSLSDYLLAFKNVLCFLSVIIVVWMSPSEVTFQKWDTDGGEKERGGKTESLKMRRILASQQTPVAFKATKSHIAYATVYSGSSF